MASLAWYHYGTVPLSTPWHGTTINTIIMVSLVALSGKWCQHYGITMAWYHYMPYSSTGDTMAL